MTAPFQAQGPECEVPGLVSSGLSLSLQPLPGLCLRLGR